MKITVGGLDESDPTKERKVFGTNWNLEEDIIVMKMNKIVEFARGLEPTKQNVLRIAAKLFGSTSDRRVTQESGLIDLLEEGDQVMADRGFTIRDLLT